MKLKILFLASWYPTRISPANGNFIQKHAECVALYNDVRLIHVCIDPSLPLPVSKETTATSFTQDIIYLKQNKIPCVGKWINYISILLVYLKEIKRIIKSGFYPDVIHANVVFPIGILALFLKWRYRIPYIITEHWTGFLPYANVKIGRLQLRIMRLIARHCSSICPVSLDLKNAMVHKGLKAPYHIVPNVVDTGLFIPDKRNNNTDRIQILHISSLKEDQKNFRLLLQALAVIRKERDDFELQVASDGIWEQYESDIQKTGLEDILFFHGNLPTEEIAKLMCTSHFFVLSSNYENLPCVLVEALSSGIPVVSTKVGGIAEIINENNGILIPANNLNELTHAIRTMLNRYTSFNKDQMHEDAVSQFSYEAIGKAYAEIYNSVINH